MKHFALVVAMDDSRGIGKGGDLAWRLPGELKHFKQVTSALRDASKQNAVIMGRKTWESLPVKFRPLPGRLNVVLTRQPEFDLPEGVVKAGSLDEALAYIEKLPQIEGIFVIGGAEMFAQAVVHPACQAIFATHVQGTFGCDAFFPLIPGRFKPAATGPQLTEGDISYFFMDYKVS